MKLDLDDPLVWDKWREHYDTMTSQEHKEFYQRAVKRYPDQKHFTFSNFEDFFRAETGLRVLEYGGFDGSLANRVFTEYPTKIHQWLNIDFVYVDQVPTSVRYGVHIPNDFKWFKKFNTNDYDLLISTHFIEHLSDEDFVEMIKNINTKNVLFEAPLKMEGQKWHGDMSTHKLEMGWSHICQLMKCLSYLSFKINDHCFQFISHKRWHNE